jgi:hypothetical protein
MQPLGRATSTTLSIRTSAISRRTARGSFMYASTGNTWKSTRRTGAGYEAGAGSEAEAAGSEADGAVPASDNALLLVEAAEERPQSRLREPVLLVALLPEPDDAADLGFVCVEGGGGRGSASKGVCLTPGQPCQHETTAWLEAAVSAAAYRAVSTPLHPPPLFSNAPERQQADGLPAGVGHKVEQLGRLQIQPGAARVSRLAGRRGVAARWGVPVAIARPQQPRQPALPLPRRGGARAVVCHCHR